MNRLILSFFLLVTALSAQTFSTDLIYASRYVFRGVQYADASLQPAVNVSVGDLTLGVWANRPVDDGRAIELDYSVGYSRSLNDNLSFDLGAVAYTYPRIDTSDGADRYTIEPYVGLSSELGSYTVSGRFYRDVTLNVMTLEGSLGYGLEVTDKTSVDALLTIGRVGSAYTYRTLGVTASYQLTESVALSAGVQYADDSTDDHVWATFGLNISL